MTNLMDFRNRIRLNGSNLSSWTVSLALVGGMAWTVSGLLPVFRQEWLGTPVKDMVAYPLLVSVLWSALAISTRVTGLSWGANGLVIGVLLSLLSGRPGPVAAVSFFALSSWALGDGVGRPLWSLRGGQHLEKALLGAGLWGTLVSLLASWPIHTPGLYATSLAVPILIRHKRVGALLHEWKQTISTPARFDQDGVLTGLVLSVGLVHFLFAFFPELGADALSSHLFVPGYMEANHRWLFDVRKYVFAVQPMMGDWIFTINAFLGGETAARLVNVLFAFGIAVLVGELVVWSGGTVRGGRWGSLLFLVTPLSLIESSSLFVECVWACFFLAGTWAFARACSDPPLVERHLMAGGAWLGFSLGTKMITLLAFPFWGALVVLALTRSGWRKSSKSLLGGLVVGLIVGGIPYFRAWCETGNPTFPFFNEVFKSPFFPLDVFNNEQFNQPLGFNLVGLITFQTGKFLECRSGAAGFHWTLIMIPILFSSFFIVRKRAIALLLGGIATMLITFHFQSYLRYVFPSIVLVVAGVSSWMFSFSPEGTGPKLIRASGLWGLIGLNIFFLPVGSFYPGLQWLSAFSSQARNDLLLVSRPMRLAVDAVNAVNTAHEPVAVLGPSYVAGVGSDVLLPSWYNHEFQGALASAQSAEAFGGVLVDRRVDFVLFQDDWGTSRERRWVEDTTNCVARFGPASVRELKHDVRFGRELLKNPMFSTLDGWSVGSNALFLGGSKGIRVSGPSPASQVVPVLGKRRYLNQVEARCSENPKAMGRIQINWADKNMKFLKADIEVFSCEREGGKYSMEVVSPSLASYAVVYASGHGPEFLDFQGVSLR